MNWLKSLFGRRKREPQPPPPPIEPVKDEVPPAEQSAPDVVELPPGDWSVLLATAGFLTERVSETLQRLTGATQADADGWVAAAPVVVMQAVDETAALKAQRELQMFGAVVEIMRGEAAQAAPSAPIALPLPESPPAPLPDSRPVDPVPISRGDFEVYLLDLGDQPADVADFLNGMITMYETPAAIEHMARQSIGRMRPILFGLSAQSAAEVAVRLETLGARARSFAFDAPDRPEYRHNHFAARLLDAGANKAAVAQELQAILGVDAAAARELIDSAPATLVENVTVQEAIAVVERLRVHGAQLDLPAPERNVWLHTGTEHIRPAAGPYRVVLQRMGETRMALSEVVAELRPDLDAAAVSDLLDSLPVVLLADVDLATAELVAMTLRDFGGAAVWQRDYDATAALHPQSPEFGTGEWMVVLEAYDPFSKVSIIKWLMDTRPGLRLAEAKPLIEALPAVVAQDVDWDTAVRLRDALNALKGVVRLDAGDGSPPVTKPS